MSATPCPLGGHCLKPCPTQPKCASVAEARSAASEESAVFDFRDERGPYRNGFVSLATFGGMTFARLSGLASAGALLGIPEDAVVRSIRMTRGSSGDEVSIEWASP